MKHYETIYNEYYEYILYFILKLTKYDYDLAEDLTQETFYQAYISIGSFKGKCLLKTWLSQIAKNCWYNYLRKNKKKLVNLSCLDELIKLSKNVEPECIVEKKEMRKEVFCALSKLNKKQRNVIILKIYFDMKFREIENILNLSEGNGKVIFYRGKEKLRRIFNSLIV